MELICRYPRPAGGAPALDLLVVPIRSPSAQLAADTTCEEAHGLV